MQTLDGNPYIVVLPGHVAALQTGTPTGLGREEAIGSSMMDYMKNMRNKSKHSRNQVQPKHDTPTATRETTQNVVTRSDISALRKEFEEDIDKLRAYLHDEMIYEANRVFDDRAAGLGGGYASDGDRPSDIPHDRRHMARHATQKKKQESSGPAYPDSYRVLKHTHSQSQDPDEQM
jgi:hypothetical protein